jgi:hypothetical protein
MEDEMSWYGETGLDWLTSDEKDALADGRGSSRSGALGGWMLVGALLLPFVANVTCWLLHGPSWALF